MVEAETGSDALYMVQTGHPDLILMDLALPGMWGDEVTALLKAAPVTRDIPLIVVTALQHDHSSVQRAIAADAEEIVAKPFLKTLGEAVRRYVRPPDDLQF